MPNKTNSICKGDVVQANQAAGEEFFGCLFTVYAVRRGYCEVYFGFANRCIQTLRFRKDQLERVGRAPFVMERIDPQPPIKL